MISKQQFCDLQKDLIDNSIINNKNVNKKWLKLIDKLSSSNVDVLKEFSKNYNNTRDAIKAIALSDDFNDLFCPYCKKRVRSIKHSTLNNTCSNKDCINLCRNSTIKKDESFYSRRSKKNKETMLNKYGVESVAQLDYVKEKIKNTLISKYGSLEEFYSERDKKIKNTCIERYGDYAINLQSTHDKSREKTRELYGCDYTFQREDIKSKIVEYNNSKYGCDYPLQSKDFRDKLCTLFFEKYGVSNPSQVEKFKKSLKDDYSNFCKVNNCTPENELNIRFGTGFSQNQDLKDKITTIAYKHRVFIDNNSIPIIEDYYNLHKYSTSSYKEELLYNYIVSIYGGRVERHNRYVLSGKELDIYLPDKNIAIEFNGTHWHSSESGLDKNYHLNKSILAGLHNIHLIHIYEYEWDDSSKRKKIELFLNILLGNCSNKIYARNCEIRKISNKDARPFNEENHLQGHRNAQVTYGLFYNDKLVQLMSFSKSKYNRNLKGNNDWEIIRGCPGSNNIVVGGVSKLLSFFIKEHDPDLVFSYCDFNKFSGISYEKCGMIFDGFTGPDKHYIIGNAVLNRNPAKYSEYKNYDTIFGAGSKKYILKLKSVEDM